MEYKSNTHQISILVPGLFASTECEKIIALMNSFALESAKVWDGEKYVVDEDYRKNSTAYIKKDSRTSWIYERMEILFKKAAEYWGLDVDETVEDLKYLRYQEGDHFSKWHADIGPGYPNKRKLSMSITLNSHDDYEGGDLEIFSGDEDQLHLKNNRSLNPGDAIVFPSFRHHRVTPVKRGIRHALINWISGPELR